MDDPRKIQSYFFVALLLSAIFLFYRILEPLTYDILMALISNIFLMPSYIYFKRKRLPPILSATLSLTIFIFVFTLPSYLLFQQLYNEVTTLNFNHIITELSIIWNTHPWVARLDTLFGGFHINEDFLKQHIVQFVNFITKESASIVQQTSYILIHVVLTLYMMFYLLIDGHILKKKLLFISPLDHKNEEQLLSKINEITKAIVYGSLLIALLEGLFGIVLFYIIGIKAPIFWGFVIVIFSLLPILGTNAIFVPAAIYCLMINDYFGFFLLAVIGVGGVLISQNVIKVKIVGNKTKIPVPLIVLTTIGGIVWLGPIGFIIGPVILGVLIAIIDQYSKRFKTQLDILNNNTQD